MGKGSGPRKGRYDRPLGLVDAKTLIYDNRTPQEKYEDGWEAIFGKKEGELRCFTGA